MTIGYLFDLDGTLALTDDMYIRVFAKLLPNVNVTKEWFAINVQGKCDEYMYSYYNDVWDSLSEFIAEKNRLCLLEVDHAPPQFVKGAIEFVKSVQNACIVTNSDRIVATRVLSICGLDHLPLVSASDVIHPKPSGEPYIRAMELLGLTDCIVFEDSLTGIRSALSANIRCIVGVETSHDRTFLTNHKCVSSIVDFASFTVRTAINLLWTVDNEAFVREIKQALGVESAQVSRVCKTGFICDIFDIFTDERRLILKTDTTNVHTVVGKVSNDLGLCTRECRFYSDYATIKDVSIPECVHVVPSYGWIFMVKLCAPRYITPTLSEDVAIACVATGAKLHAQNWGSTPLEPIEYSRHIYKLVPAFKRSTVLPTSFVNRVCGLLDQYYDIEFENHSGVLTLIHGDFKLPNMFWDTETNCPCLIDWQYVAGGKGMQDIAFIAVESFGTIDVMMLLEVYIKELSAYNIKYTLQEACRDFTFALHYFPIFVVVWFGSVDIEQHISSVDFIKRFATTLDNMMHRFPLSAYA